MILNNAIAFCAVVIVLAIATKMITGSALNSIRRKLVRMHERKRDLLIELEHARERHEAARNTVAFYEARRHEVEDRIHFTEEDLQALVAELDGEDKPEDKTIGVHDRSKDVVRRLAD
jgi:hypothetical protein